MHRRGGIVCSSFLRKNSVESRGTAASCNNALYSLATLTKEIRNFSSLSRGSVVKRSKKLRLIVEFHSVSDRVLVRV